MNEELNEVVNEVNEEINEKANEFKINVDSSQIGFRLQYMEFVNWGTFHDKIWRIDPNGSNSLLTGSIGSGKSTVVDALTSLIVPHHKITFNKAAGAESKERTLATYIKGEYKNTKNEESETKRKAVSLRYKDANDATFTIILANFSNAGYGSNITLAQVFWIENEKTQKLLIVSSKPLTIKEHFTKIQDARELRKRIKSFSDIEYEGESFPEYSQKFRHLFGMNSEKAIDLFNQTVSMKSVSSLTSFVREQMLEKTEIKEQLEELKKRFSDLNKSYAAVQEARKQRDILKPIVELSTNYGDFEKQLQEINNILQAIPSYFEEKKMVLLESEVKLCETKLNQLTNQLSDFEEDLRNRRKTQSEISQDIEKNGGARLKQIANEILQREKDKKAKKDKYDAYIKLTEVCGLSTANTDKTFYSNRKLAEEKIENLVEIQDFKSEQQAEKAADQRTLKEQIVIEENELISFKSRLNQIPTDFAQIRESLAIDLGIDEKEIPFVGELIKVREEESSWEGALERLLRGFGISMLVPEKYYKQVSQYINVRSLANRGGRGLKLDYFLVPENFKPHKNHNEIDMDSVVNKIEIKAGAAYFEDWIEAKLENNFNLKCVSIEEFQKQKRDVITIQGQYKRGEKHTKDDRSQLWDRKNFILGWTNTDKVKAVEYSLKELLKAKQIVDTALSNLKTEVNSNMTLNTKLNLVVAYTNWNEINWQDEVKEIAKLVQEKTDLEASSDVLKSLQDKLDTTLEEIIILEKKQKSKSEEIGAVKRNIEDYNEEIRDSLANAKNLVQAENASYYLQIEALVSDTKLTFKNIDGVAKELNARYTGGNGEKDKLNKKLLAASNGIIKVMQTYKKEYPSETNELSDEIDSRTEFIKIFNKIIADGLPAHEARFKDMLNKNTIDDIRVFDAKLDSHYKQIRKKIEEINKHLKEIDFNKGTYIKLIDDRNSDIQIKNFKNDLRECYSGILDTTDAYTEDRFARVKTFLDRFMSNQSEDVEWTKKVTDVRNWFLFNASERFLDDDAEKEFYADTSGKSGGQKEKLAYTILASALAYQFGLSYGEPNSKSFRFVVIDEAFGRGDDESTQFGLGLFKKLNLQLLIVTPLQKIHVIENYINSVHYVSNTEGNNSQLQNLSVSEYKAEKHSHNTIYNGTSAVKSAITPVVMSVAEAIEKTKSVAKPTAKSVAKSTKKVIKKPVKTTKKPVKKKPK